MIGRVARETVLLVDDEPAVRRMTSRILSEEGYAVLSANHGVDGLAVINGDAEQCIRILITDIVMPIMNGKKLAEAVRKVRPDLPILFVSGYSDELIAEAGPTSEVIPLLRKPFTPAELLAEVRRILDAV